MPIQLYDTLTRAKQPLVPADPKRVTMYVCGPTVYNRAHIGNARPAVVFDLLARLLRHDYGDGHVVYARNVTDIEDKIIASAAAEGVPIETITDRYEQHYLADMGALGVTPPDKAPHATDHVGGMVAMIATLIERGHAYAAEGHVLFDVASYADYGKLSRRPLDEMIAGARVEVAPYKRSPADFVLWKPSDTAQPGWDSPWGRGRPGWHIECSAMIEAVLGTTIDIHGGGLDLQFPHHENEVAQSACAHGGAPLARIWMHNGFLSMGTEKMSKSLGNVVLVSDLLAANHSGPTLRLALLSAHYRKPLIWTESLLAESRSRLERMYRAVGYFSGLPSQGSPPTSFYEALCDDLNTPKALSELSRLTDELEQRRLQAQELYKRDWRAGEDARRDAVRLAGALRNGLKLLGLWKSKSKTSSHPTPRASWVNQQIQLRAFAKAQRNFAEADRIRSSLGDIGIILEDGASGTTWRRA